MAVTVYDIAEKSGASVATVSRALRGLSKRQTPIQKRILEVSRELGYERRERAGGDEPAETGQILFLDSAHADEVLAREMHYGPAYRAIQEVIEPQGYSLIISSVAGSKPLPPILRSPEKISGVLIHGPFSRAFFDAHLAGLPVVGLHYVNYDLPCSWVSVDNTGGIHQVMKHLHALGHRRIAFLANEVERVHSAQRYRAYQEVMATFGLTIQPTWRMVWQRPFVDGVLPAETRLPDFLPWIAPAFSDRAHAPTAIVASGNWQARATIMALSKSGLSVPEDVSVTGWGRRMMGIPDDIEWGEEQDFEGLTWLEDPNDTAAMAARLLLEQIGDSMGRPGGLADSQCLRVVQVRPRLVVGRSTRAL